MSEQSLKKVLPKVKVKRTSVVLCTVWVHSSGEVWRPAEEIDTQGAGPSLLGREWLKNIRLHGLEGHWFSVNVPYHDYTLNALLSKYGEIFRGELGTMKGIYVWSSVSDMLISTPFLNLLWPVCGLSWGKLIQAKLMLLDESSPSTWPLIWGLRSSPGFHLGWPPTQDFQRTYCRAFLVSCAT